MAEPLEWSDRVIDIPDGGLRQSRTATPSELKAVAQALDVLACERIDADYSVRALGGGSYRLAGRVKAELTQACVVTLEPLQQKIEGEFDVEFRPPAKVPVAADDEEFEALAVAEIEPLEHGQIDTGRIVFETLSATMDPFPRAPGAELDPEALQTDSGEDKGPFAALKALKERG